MTGPIFAALEMRFNASPALVLNGRKLYQGFDEERTKNKNVIWPYVEVAIGESESLSTWAADIDKWELRFLLHSKDLRPNAAQLWLDAMRAAYKDAGTGLNAAAFTCCGCRELSASGPTTKAPGWEATMRFMLVVQWRQLAPSIRGG